MENENASKIETVNKFEQLHKVTPLSKYLAAALFIVLPFVGGWIGYQHSPEKIVEIEKSVTTQSQQNFDNVESITWSTWFGECVGYCHSELVVRADAVITRSKSWDNELEPTILNTYDHTAEDFKTLLVNLNTQSLLELPERIGCPDCADQGGESIKIGFGDGLYKTVSYSYGEAPIGLKSFKADLIELDRNLALERMKGKSCVVDQDCVLVQPDCEDCTFDVVNKNDLHTFRTEKNNRCELNPPQKQCDVVFGGEVGCVENTCQIIN